VRKGGASTPPAGPQRRKFDSKLPPDDNAGHVLCCPQAGHSGGTRDLFLRQPLAMPRFKRRVSCAIRPVAAGVLTVTEAVLSSRLSIAGRLLFVRIAHMAGRHGQRASELDVRCSPLDFAKPIHHSGYRLPLLRRLH
jgi:hypothetical protein